MANKLLLTGGAGALGPSVPLVNRTVYNGLVFNDTALTPLSYYSAAWEIGDTVYSDSLGTTPVSEIELSYIVVNDVDVEFYELTAGVITRIGHAFEEIRYYYTSCASWDADPTNATPNLTLYIHNDLAYSDMYCWNNELVTANPEFPSDDNYIAGVLDSTVRICPYKYIHFADCLTALDVAANLDPYEIPPGLAYLYMPVTVAANTGYGIYTDLAMVTLVADNSEYYFVDEANASRELEIPTGETTVLSNISPCVPSFQIINWNDPATAAADGYSTAGISQASPLYYLGTLAIGTTIYTNEICTTVFNLGGSGTVYVYTIDYQQLIVDTTGEVTDINVTPKKLQCYADCTNYNMSTSPFDLYIQCGTGGAPDWQGLESDAKVYDDAYMNNNDPAFWESNASTSSFVHNGLQYASTGGTMYSMNTCAGS